MTRVNRAVFLHGPRDLRAASVEVPALGDGDVLVRVRSCGVCGSDVHYWKDGRIGPYVIEEPLILGHECAGEVVDAGPGVASLRVGDRVALEPGVPCRHCEACRTGHYNLCPDVVFMATPPVHGAFVEYLAHPADFAFRLPENVSFEEGAMAEPLSVGIHAMRRGQVQAGAHVFIAGAGPIGLCALLAARASGAAKVYVSDVRAKRLAVARQLGADGTIDLTQVPAGDAIMELTHGRGVDAAFECSGNTASYESIFSCVRQGGIVLLIGEDAVEFPFPVFNILVKELDVRGLFRYANTYPAALDLISAGLIDVKPLITHRFAFSEIDQAFQTAGNQDVESIKVVRP